MKKALSILLAITLCLSLLGCHSGSTSGGSNNGSGGTGNQGTSNNNGTSQTPPSYNKQDLSSICTYIDTETELAISVFESDTTALSQKLGKTYETYYENKDSIPAYFTVCLANAETLFAKLQSACIDYYKQLASQGLDDYNTWDDAMDDLYDVWDEAYDDFYDTWDDAYDDIYELCDDLIEDGSDTLSYSEYSSLWSSMYDNHSAAWSTMYDTHSAAWSLSYDNHSAVWSGFYDDKTDVDAILKAAVKEDTNDSSSNTKPDDESTESDNDSTGTDDTQSELIDGMRPEFKAAMDAYESFYNEYCDFLKKMNENPTDITLILQYGEMLIKVSEVDKTFDEWDSDELNNTELAYYIAVQTRVAQKLASVAN